jgi:hypothetical protein
MTENNSSYIGRRGLYDDGGKLRSGIIKQDSYRENCLVFEVDGWDGAGFFLEGDPDKWLHKVALE